MTPVRIPRFQISAYSMTAQQRIPLFTWVGNAESGLVTAKAYAAGNPVWGDLADFEAVPVTA